MRQRLDLNLDRYRKRRPVDCFSRGGSMGASATGWLHDAAYVKT
jgi:hypothetical protein